MKNPALIPVSCGQSRGATAVEMAIATPLLFMIVLGLLEICHAFMVQHVIQDAARRGCRTAVLPRSSNSAVLETVNSLLQAEGIRHANATILVNNTAADVAQAKTSDTISVQITIAAADVSIVPGCGYLRGQQKASASLRLE